MKKGKSMASKTKKQKQDDFFFDDCLICQTMQKADTENRSLSVSELKDVFQKANDEQTKKKSER